MFDRRRFLKLIPAAAAAAAVLPQACAELAQAAKPTGLPLPIEKVVVAVPRMISGYEISEIGELSLDGQTSFPLYGCYGGLSFGLVSYHVIDDHLYESRSYSGGRSIIGDADLGRGCGTQWACKLVARIRRDTAGYEYFDPLPL